MIELATYAKDFERRRGVPYQSVYRYASTRGIGEGWTTRQGGRYMVDKQRADVQIVAWLEKRNKVRGVG